jgi:beta-N-acetylhexosaminidase
MEEIYLSKLTLREKLGQLLIIKPHGLNEKYLNELKISGIFLNNLKTKYDYMKAIEFYQQNSNIKLFVATDMEGYYNPFLFYKSPSFGEIKDDQESYDLGLEHGRVLSELGFNLNFSPLVEVRNNVWPGRTFKGITKQEIREKISAYIKGLHKYNIMATAKHYPGGSLIKNPHFQKFRTEIFHDDLDYFNFAIKEGVEFIMVGHPIVHGAVDSNGKQATLSREILEPLRKKFNGLIITDAITMLGLRLSYLFDLKKIYADLIRAGNDIILDTHINSNFYDVKRRLEELEHQVKQGKLSEQVVNDRVKRILEAKGYVVF